MTIELPGLVRRARADDASALPASDWRRWLDDRSSDVLLVCEAAPAGPVGFVLASRSRWYGMDGRFHDLQVLPEHRRRGHGRLLLHGAAAELAALGCGPVGLLVEEGNPVRAWYDHLGGVPVDDEVTELGGWTRRELVYRWEVAAELARRLA